MAGSGGGLREGGMGAGGEESLKGKMGGRRERKGVDHGDGGGKWAIKEEEAVEESSSYPNRERGGGGSPRQPRIRPDFYLLRVCTMSTSDKPGPTGLRFNSYCFICCSAVDAWVSPARCFHPLPDSPSVVDRVLAVVPVNPSCPVPKRCPSNSVVCGYAGYRSWWCRFSIAFKLGPPAVPVPDTVWHR